MAVQNDLARVNLLLEFLSDCARVVDRDSLLRIVAGRLRWVLPFDRCTLALKEKAQVGYWSVSSDQDIAGETAPSDLPDQIVAGLERALRKNLPVSDGPPIKLICHPLRSGERVVGAIGLSRSVESYSYKDVSFANQVAGHLGATIGRLEYDSLDDESRAKDEFLARLSHELRNPLAPILTSIQVLRLKGQFEGSELDIIQRQASQLVRLVDDLLDVARLARGKVVLSKEWVRVADAIIAAAESCETLFRERRIDLHTVHDAAPDTLIHADATRVQQVFVNLLSNAARYTGPGGRVVISSSVAGERVVVAVADNGIGIPKDVLPKIFDEFFQGSDVRGKQGLGLGLTIVKSLTELHGGEVSADSDGPGKGSVFSTSWPQASGADRSSAAAAPSQLATTPISQSPRSILLVDDNKDAADSIGEFLGLSGHQVTVSYSAIEALGRADALRPAIAILDIGMPDIDGYDLAQRIRAKLGNECPYLIALTGFGREVDKARSEMAGFDLFLVKPVDPKELTDRIAAIG